MVYSRTGYTIATNGQSLVIAAPTVGGTTATVYSDAECTSSVTFPETITSDKTYYVHPDAPGRYLVSAKQLDGTELWGGKVDCFRGDGVKTISPLPSVAQVSEDLSGALQDNGNALVIDVIPRGTASNITAPSASTGYYSHFTAPRSMTVTNISMCSGSATTGSPTLIKFGLFTVDSNEDLTLVAATASDTAIFGSANTVYTKALTATYDVVKGQRYATGLVIVGGTPGTIVGSTGNGTVNFLSRVLSSYKGTQTDMASVSGVGSDSRRYWARLT